MKLLFAIGDISAYGGTERVTSEIASAFASHRNQVTILSLFGSASPYFDLYPDVKVKSAELQEANGSLLRYSKISQKLFNECREEQADALVLVDSILFAFCLPWRFFSSTKIIVWEHFNLTTSHGTKMRDLARLAASRLSHRVVVLTERDVKFWRHKYRIGNKVKAIWNPIPNFKQSQKNIVSEYNAESRVVLALGRLTNEKGFDLLLKAWQLLGDSINGWILKIVGSGEKDQDLKLLAKKLNINDSVVFAGQTKNVEDEYLNASVFVMSSRWEGLPMTLLEAQYFGLPSVSTDCETGPREVLSCGSGLLVPPEDPIALAEGIKHLINDPEMMYEMSKKAKENAVNYESSYILQEWKMLFSDLGLKS